MPSSEWQHQDLTFDGLNADCRGLQWSPSGELYICGTDGVIYVSDPTFEVVRFAGCPGRAVQNGHRLHDAGFNMNNYAVGLAFLDSGDILLAECMTHQIRRFSGDMVSTYAGSTPGYLDGHVSVALFNLPTSIVEFNDKLIITDSQNHAIRMITREGYVSTLEMGRQRRMFEGVSNTLSFPFQLITSPDMHEVIISDLATNIIFSLEPGKAGLSTICNATNPRSVSSLPNGDLLISCYSNGFYLYSRANDTLKILIKDDTATHVYDSTISPLLGALAWSERTTNTIRIIRNFCEPIKTTSFVGPDLYTIINRQQLSDLSVTLQDCRNLALHRHILALSFETLSSDATSSNATSDPTLDHRIAKFVQLCSKFPSDLVEVFIRSLYGNLALLSSSSRFDQALMLTMLVFMYAETGMDTLSLEMTFNAVLFSVPVPKIVKLLSLVWNECNRHKHLCEIIVDHLRKRHNANWSLQDEFPNPDADLLLLAQSIAESSSSLYLTSSVRDAEAHLPIHSALLRAGEAVFWNSSPVPSSPPPPATKFRLSIAEKDGYVEVDEYILYAQWSWFRRLLDSGLEESRTLHCELPSSFTSNLLLVLVKFLYTHRVMKDDLVIGDATCLLSSGEEFGFHDSEGEGIEPFQPLVLMCRDFVGPSL